MSGEFLDTNILVYAHDHSAGFKRKIAAELVLRLYQSKRAILSLQVLAEFVVTATRKLPQPLEKGDVKEIVTDLSVCKVYSPKAEDIVAALDLTAKYQIHFWDAMIIRAAIMLGASIIWTEDLNDGQYYEGVVVRNPFK
jgi:predicted nucleic acid-binding protein